MQTETENAQDEIADMTQQPVPMADVPEDTAAEDQGHSTPEEPEYRESADGQMEITMPETPLWHKSESLVVAQVRLKEARADFEKAESEWLAEMEAQNKGSVQHRNEKMEFVKGRTTKDHVRFKK